VLEEEAEGFQVAESKCKKITARDKEGQQLSKKAKRETTREVLQRHCS